VKAPEREALLRALKARFEKHAARHPGIAWAAVQARLDAHPEALPVLHAMEATGGEPDVIGPRGEAGELVFCDCAAESPAGRRSLCYDRAALDARKENKPRAAPSSRPPRWASSCSTRRSTGRCRRSASLT
jgi:hypothetical protein